MAATGGNRSLLAPWVGGASCPPGAAPPTGGYFALLGFWCGGIGNGGNAPPPPPPPSVELLGGTPGKRRKHPQDFFFTPAWHKFDQEARSLDAAAAEKEKRLHEERLSNQIQERADFAAYEAKKTQEISNLRIRRDWLIRQMQEEEVIVAILRGLPTLN